MSTPIVELRADADAGVPLSALTSSVADAIAQQFDDRVLVLHFVSERAMAHLRGAPLSRRGKVEHLYLSPSTDCLTAIAGATLESDVLFIDCAGENTGTLAAGTLRAIASKVTICAHLTRDANAQPTPPHADCELLRTVLLPNLPERSRSRSRSLAASSLSGILARGLAERITTPSDAPRAKSVSYEQFESSPPLRVRLDFEEIRRRDRELATGASPRNQEGLNRLARALTHRRVGLALGGAGAWGYSCVPLMDALLERRIPIDVVAGTSSGALIGAYYCALGREGLARIVERGASLGRALPFMTLSSAPAEWIVDSDLGGLRLEELEVPLLPVVTNLTKRQREVIVNGTVGFGVRASVSAPGVFAPVTCGQDLLVDGAVTDNVPAELAEAAGANLVIAANALPAGLEETRASARNPLHRARQFLSAFQLLLHSAGDREEASSRGARRIVYSASAVKNPLYHTFDYASAKRIAETARTDESLLAAVDEAAIAWRELAATPVAKQSHRRSLNQPRETWPTDSSLVDQRLN